MSKISMISGIDFYWSVIYGVKKIIQHQEELNKINVFPVPDGDTGTNLATTGASIVHNAKQNDSLDITAASIADVALDGARGNSGVIFAQFLYGISQELKGFSSLSTENFAKIMKKAYEYLYQAIPSPQEGTIITVIYQWADYLYQNCHHDFETLFDKAEAIASEALINTKNQLNTLKIANVVDAGAKGFVLFLEGMKEALFNPNFSPETIDINEINIDSIADHNNIITNEDIKFRYCTETCLIGEHIDRKHIQSILEQHSDSIVIAGSEEKMRLHFHTNQPNTVFAELAKFGEFSFQKIEDMVMQYEMMHKRKTSIALVIDSCVGFDSKWVNSNQIHIVPLNLNVNNQKYIDYYGFGFEEYMSQTDATIRTAQPSPISFRDKFQQLAKHYDSIIVLTVSSRGSGTYASAIQGKQLANVSIPIDIIDSEHVSGSAGIIAYHLGEDIKKGLSQDQIIENAKKYIKNTKEYINLKSIETLIKSGRINPIVGKIIKLLGVCPVIGAKNGKGSPIAASMGFKNALKKSLSFMKKDLKKFSSVSDYIVVHSCTNEHQLNSYLDQLTKTLGKKPATISTLTPALAMQLGIDSFSVGIIYNN
ncbi:MAG: DegV family protein [Brevinema sp.]